MYVTVLRGIFYVYDRTIPFLFNMIIVASKCGFTPQYEGLEELYKKYKDQGFTVIGTYVYNRVITMRQYRLFFLNDVDYVPPVPLLITVYSFVNFILISFVFLWYVSAYPHSIGFPCNQFGGQEPGTEEEVNAFACTKYKTTFPVSVKIDCVVVVVHTTTTNYGTVRS